MTSPTRALQGLPNAALVAAAVVVMAVSALIAVFILSANVMACDSGSEGCADRALLATLIWAAMAFGGPIAAMVWGLLASRTTRGGRTRRIVALVLIIAAPIAAIGINLAIIVIGLPG